MKIEIRHIVGNVDYSFCVEGECLGDIRDLLALGREYNKPDEKDNPTGGYQPDDNGLDILKPPQNCSGGNGCV